MKTEVKSRFIDRIRNLLRERATSPLDRGFVAEFMIEIRQLLEDTGSKTMHQRVNLYCNWYVHATLSESSSIMDVLRHCSALTETMRNGAATPDNLGKYWEQSLGLDLLRMELLALMSSAGLPILFFQNDGNWRQFIGLLLRNLEGKSLRLPDGHDQPPVSKDRSIVKKAKQSYSDALLMNQGNKSATFVEITIVLEKDPWDPRPELFVEPTFHIKVTNAEQVSFITKMPTSLVPG